MVLTEYEKIKLFLWSGFIAMVIEHLIYRYASDFEILGFPLGIGGAILFIWGCCLLAKGKGYPSLLGLLGLLSLIGLLIIWLLPDRRPDMQPDNRA